MRIGPGHDGPVTPWREVVVTYRKWPSKPHWSVAMAVLGRDDAGLWLGTRRGTPLDRVGTPAHASGDSVVLFTPGRPWSPRWYSRPGPSGRASRFSSYVDIISPPEISDDRVDVVDLDLDVARRWDGVIEVLDEDEFAERQLSQGYPPQIVTMATEACEHVSRALRGGTAPFGGEHARWANEWFEACDRLDAASAQDGSGMPGAVTPGEDPAARRPQ